MTSSLLKCDDVSVTSVTGYSFTMDMEGEKLNQVTAASISQETSVLLSISRPLSFTVGATG